MSEIVNPHTLKIYSQSLALFAEFMGAKEITKAEIMRFRDSRAKVEKPNSVNIRLHAIKAFCSWRSATKGGLNPGHKIRQLETSKAFKGLTQDDVARLVSVCKCQDRPLLRFVPLLLLWTGLRNNEARELTWGHRQGDWLTSVPGKGDKPRNIPISEELREELDVYASIVGKGRDSEPLLVSPKGGPLNNKTIYNIVRSVCQDAGIPDAKPHSLRHTFAYMTLDRLERDGLAASQASRIVMSVMGHSSFDTTLKYLTVREDEIGKAFFGRKK